MGLHLTPAAAERAYLEPPEYDDPLELVEFPRERKPWKRDRDTIRSAMNGAINRRCWANMREDGMETRDHHMRFWFLNMARYEIWRHFFLDHRRQHPTVRAESVARLRRYVLAARRFDKPPLPASADTHPTGGDAVAAPAPLSGAVPEGQTPNLPPEGDGMCPVCGSWSSKADAPCSAQCDAETPNISTRTPDHE